MTENTTKNLIRFQKWAFITTLAIIFLIWVGGWVRSTGAGMGCPDWPKCFGTWIPPTDVSQLPANYQEIYKESYKNTTFNVLKTWTEYLNRLVGVAIGGFVILTVVFAFPLRKNYPSIFWLSVAGLLLVLLEGWIGGQVVKKNLHEGIITIHMILAMINLMVLISAWIRAKKVQNPNLGISIPKNLYYIGIFACFLALAQVMIGTQVRENVDAVSKLLGDEKRNEWIGQLGIFYIIHKNFYYIVTAGLLYWIYNLMTYLGSQRLLKNLSFGIIFLLIAEIFMGLIMHYTNIPPVLQPLHLLFGVLIFIFAYTIVVNSKQIEK